MKLINKSGEVVDEFDDNDGVLVFKKDGVMAIIPTMNDDDKVPDHVMMCAATMIYLGEEDGRAAIESHWDTKVKRPH